MTTPRLARRWALWGLLVAGLLAGGSLAYGQATKPATGTTGTTKKKDDAKGKAPAPATASDKVDLNSATAEELMTLSGVGEAYARRIIEGRPYKSITDLSSAGVPAATIEKLRPMAVVHLLPAPVDVNHDSAAQLETLPGIGPALAKEIIAGRPYAHYADLEKVKGIGPAKLDALRGRLKFGVSTPAGKAKTTKAARPITDSALPEKSTTTASTRSTVAKKSASSTKAVAGEKVNINTASKGELDALPGIGPVKAQAIIDGRPFATIEDIMKVKGIKDGEFSKIKDMIRVR
jgi:competence protein ComEA